MSLQQAKSHCQLLSRSQFISRIPTHSNWTVSFKCSAIYFHRWKCRIEHSVSNSKILQKLHQAINTIISPAMIWSDMDDYTRMQWEQWLGMDNGSIRKWLLNIPDETKWEQWNNENTYQLGIQYLMQMGSTDMWKSTINELNRQAHVHGSSKTVRGEGG